MSLSLRPLLPAILIVSALAACAPLPPIPYQLFERDQIYPGFFFPSERRIETTIADKRFEGFYLFATGTAYSQGLWLRRGLPNDMVTTFSSNAAKATMISSDGERLFCDFIIEGRRAIGECKSGHGQSYRLATQAR